MSGIDPRFSCKGMKKGKMVLTDHEGHRKICSKCGKRTWEPRSVGFGKGREVLCKQCYAEHPSVKGLIAFAKKLDRFHPRAGFGPEIRAYEAAVNRDAEEI